MEVPRGISPRGALAVLLVVQGGPAKRSPWSRLSSLDYLSSFHSPSYLARRLFDSPSCELITKKTLTFVRAF